VDNYQKGECGCLGTLLGNIYNQQYTQAHQEHEGKGPLKGDFEGARGTGALKGDFVRCSDSGKIFNSFLDFFCGDVCQSLARSFHNGQPLLVNR